MLRALVLSIDGQLVADGLSGSAIASVNHPGAGAGGSIWLTAAEMSGGGLVHAKGGLGTAGCVGQNMPTGSGGGGGGCIAFEYSTYSLNDSNVSVTGGAKGAGGAFRNPGQPGSICKNGAGADCIN